MRGKVSVVIVNWNGARYLERCLSNASEQTIKPQEIIVVDNASSDNSVEIIERFSSVRLIKRGSNSGFAIGNNSAFDEISDESEWVALLNPDAFAEPKWLETLLIAAEQNPAFDAFGSKLVTANDPLVLDGVGDAYHVSGLVWRRGHGMCVTRHEESTREVFSACAAAALYRRSALFKLGGFDEDYFCYVEDIDLGFRLRLAGYRCLYVPKSVVHHVGSGTTGENSSFSLYHGHRNLVWTFVKDMPGFLFWALLPLHVMLNLFSIIWFTMLGKGGVILRAKFDALIGLPNMWRKRQLVQKLRVVSIGEIWQQLDKSVLPKKLFRPNV